MCEHCHEEEYNAVILNLEDGDLECGVITIFEMEMSRECIYMR